MTEAHTRAKRDMRSHLLTLLVDLFTIVINKHTIKQIEAALPIRANISKNNTKPTCPPSVMTFDAKVND